MSAAPRPGVGATIRYERQMREIGLRELARQIGISGSELSRIERDEVAPTGKVLQAIGRVFENTNRKGTGR